MKKILLSLIAAVAMTSCAFGPYLTYSVGLSPLPMSIKIPWDDVAYISPFGQTGRVMHSGVKYIDRNNSQPASVVPKGASLSDIIMPTDNVYYVSGQYGGWREGKLFNFAIDKNNVEQSMQEHIGKTVRLLFPVITQDVKNEYVFEFKVEDIIQKKQSMQIECTDKFYLCIKSINKDKL